jgi:hypothetical protein
MVERRVQLAESLRTSPPRRSDTRGQMVLEDYQAHFPQGCTDRTELDKEFRAVPLVPDHAPERSHVTLDTGQSVVCARPVAVTMAVSFRVSLSIFHKISPPGG